MVLLSGRLREGWAMRLKVLSVSLVLAVLVACGSYGNDEPGAGKATGVSFRRAAALIDTEDGSVIFEVEVAQSEEELAQGLMGRESLESDHGMAFVFLEETTNSFWMKDTSIPLSIAFIGEDSRIQEILDMEPCSTTDDCPVYSSADPYEAALEVNQGAFEDAGVAVGDRVTLSF
jgi:uncharacterized protein